MRRIKIREPFWKFHSVGIDEAKADPDGVEVEILYRHKITGERIWPGFFRVSRKTIMGCKVWTLPSKLRLRLVPISSMTRVPLTSDELAEYKAEIRDGCTQRMLDFKEREAASQRKS